MPSDTHLDCQKRCVESVGVSWSPVNRVGSQVWTVGKATTEEPPNPTTIQSNLSRPFLCLGYNLWSCWYVKSLCICHSLWVFKNKQNVEHFWGNDPVSMLLKSRHPWHPFLLKTFCFHQTAWLSSPPSPGFGGLPSYEKQLVLTLLIVYNTSLCNEPTHIQT